jgi:hypothetical protein
VLAFCHCCHVALIMTLFTSWKYCETLMQCAIAIAVFKNEMILGWRASICFPGFGNTEYTDSIVVGEGRENRMIPSRENWPTLLRLKYWRQVGLFDEKKPEVENLVTLSLFPRETILFNYNNTCGKICMYSLTSDKDHNAEVQLWIRPNRPVSAVARS